MYKNINENKNKKIIVKSIIIDFVFQRLFNKQNSSF